MRCKTGCGRQTAVIQGEGPSEYCGWCYIAKAPGAKHLRGLEKGREAARHTRGSDKRRQDRYVEKLLRERSR